MAQAEFDAAITAAVAALTSAEGRINATNDPLSQHFAISLKNLRLAIEEWQPTSGGLVFK